MEIRINHIGGSANKPSAIIDLTIISFNAEITEDITGLDKRVDEDFIQSLRNIADELELQNELVDKETIK